MRGICCSVACCSHRDGYDRERAEVVKIVAAVSMLLLQDVQEATASLHLAGMNDARAHMRTKLRRTFHVIMYDQCTN